MAANPDKSILALDKLESIFVTGRVEDIRPYISHADCIVAPLQIARGIQNKVLEAMAMAKPIVLTPQAAEGISVVNTPAYKVAEQAQVFANEVCDVLSERKPNFLENRQFVLEHFSWEASLKTLEGLLNE